MAKTINFEYKGKEITLEFTRETVKKMESTGFRLEFATTRPVTFVDTLFAGAFLAHHKNMAGDSKLLESIFSQMSDREKLIDRLTDMYIEPMLTLYEESVEESETGNLKWGGAD